MNQVFFFISYCNQMTFMKHIICLAENEPTIQQQLSRSHRHRSEHAVLLSWIPLALQFGGHSRCVPPKALPSESLCRKVGTSVAKRSALWTYAIAYLCETC
jgi:hypothetical protein